MYELNKGIAERFIFFDEPEHKYTDNFGNVYTSVTTGIGKCIRPFDKKKWAKIKARELNTSEASITKQWDNINKHSLNIGNTKHDRLEGAVKTTTNYAASVTAVTSKFARAVNTITFNNVNRCFSVYDLAEHSNLGEMDLDEFYAKIGHKYPTIFETVKYYVEQGFKIFSEINVYDPVNLISGLIDILLVKENIIVIVDWKTNRNDINFESGYYKKDKATNELTSDWVRAKRYMLYPLDNVEDCVGNHYNLQLSMYASMTEAFGYECKGLILFHIRDTFVTNRWGMPKKDKQGLYIVDDTKPERVQPHIMTYMKREARILRNYIGNGKQISTQHKLIVP